MFGELGKMMKMLGQLKTRLPEMQAKLESSRYTAEAGGGAVSATVNGKLGLIDIKISPEVPAERLEAEMLEDLVKAAVSAAQAKAAKAAKKGLSELTGGMELPPGLDQMLG
ncbi:MAG: YbaB/EbfC family nucleoid-associated protein [Phycisphaerae bacterium]|nr:YbaB/EbfC family nucleoid-associated protein [Phycisphaerae bacterium]